jgi:hypothetical protein
LSELPDHVRRNRGEWTSWAPEFAEEAPALWAEEISWGHRYPGLPERWWARQWPSEEIWRARKR